MVTFDRSLYPFKSHFHTQSDGHRLHFLDEGEGSPVVMVHGNPSWSFYYRNLVLGLKDHYRCIVPDHIGCGLSDKPDDNQYVYTLSSRIKDFSLFMDSQIPEGLVDLVVHDWGGAIGMGWAVQNAHRIRRLVVLNTGAFLDPKKQTLPFTLWLVRNTPFGSLLVRGFNAFSIGTARTGVVNKMSPAVYQGYTAPYHSWASRIATLRFVQDIPLSEQDEAYSTLLKIDQQLKLLHGKPMLIGWGKKDFVFDDAFLKEWQNRFTQAKVHSYKNAGHYILEDKGEDLVPKIKQFLDKTE